MTSLGGPYPPRGPFGPLEAGGGVPPLGLQGGPNGPPFGKTTALRGFKDITVGWPPRGGPATCVVLGAQ